MIFIAVSRPADEQDSHWRLTDILKSVHCLARNENGVASFDHPDFTTDGHSSRSLQDVVNLFSLDVMMPPDGCAHRQYFFSETASFDVRRGAINQRADLRAVRSIDDGGALAIYDNH